MSIQTHQAKIQQYDPLLMQDIQRIVLFLILTPNSHQLSPNWTRRITTEHVLIQSSHSSRKQRSNTEYPCPIIIISILSQKYFLKPPQLVVSIRIQPLLIKSTRARRIPDDRTVKRDFWLQDPLLNPRFEPFDGWESLEKTLTWFLFRGNAPINWVRKWKNTQSWGKWGHKKNIEARLDFCDRRTN